MFSLKKNSNLIGLTIVEDFLIHSKMENETRDGDEYIHTIQMPIIQLKIQIDFISLFD